MDKQNKTAEEIKKAGIWLSKQNYQREQGEQEYMMYFDVDIPEMLAKYSSEQLTQQQDVNAELQEKLTCIQHTVNNNSAKISELKKQNAELVEALKNMTKEYSSVLQEYNLLIAPEQMDYQTIHESLELLSKYESTTKCRSDCPCNDPELKKSGKCIN